MKFSRFRRLDYNPSLETHIENGQQKCKLVLYQFRMEVSINRGPESKILYALSDPQEGTPKFGGKKKIGIIGIVSKPEWL